MVPIKPPTRPSATTPRSDQVSRTRSQTQTNAATANVAQACENGGATYM
jgi:hypothetical protein